MRKVSEFNISYQFANEAGKVATVRSNKEGKMMLVFSLRRNEQYALKTHLNLDRHELPIFEEELQRLEQRATRIGNRTVKWEGGIARVIFYSYVEETEEGPKTVDIDREIPMPAIASARWACQATRLMRMVGQRLDDVENGIEFEIELRKLFDVGLRVIDDPTLRPEPPPANKLSEGLLKAKLEAALGIDADSETPDEAAEALAEFADEATEPNGISRLALMDPATGDVEPVTEYDPEVGIPVDDDMFAEVAESTPVEEAPAPVAEAPVEDAMINLKDLAKGLGKGMDKILLAMIMNDIDVPRDDMVTPSQATTIKKAVLQA